MAISLTEAREQLDAWLAASKAVASNQSYSINGRSLTRADAGEIQSQIEFWEKRVLTLSQFSKPIRRIVVGTTKGL